MGVILTDEKVCKMSVKNAPVTFKRWYQQDVKNSKETLFLKEFVIERFNFELSFVIKTKSNEAQETSRNMTGPLRYLQMSGLRLINVDEASLKLNRFEVQRSYIGKDDMVDFMSKFYMNNMLQ